MKRNPRDAVGYFLLKVLKNPNVPILIKNYIRDELKKPSLMEVKLAAARDVVVDNTKTDAERRAALDILLDAYRGDPV